MKPEYNTIEKEYEKNKELKKEDVDILQEWMKKQAHLPKISDLKVVCFLHSCYYKIEPTKTCIENFFTVKAHWPEFALNRNISSNALQQIINTVLVTVLPIPTKNKHVVAYSRLMDPNPEVFDHLTQLKVFDMINSTWFRKLGTTPGQVLLMDMEGSTFGHMVKINLPALKKYMFYIQEAYPIRLKAIHMLNVSPLTDKIMALAKPLMNKGMWDIIHMHPKIDSVYEHIPKEALPNEYGGQAGTFKELHEKQIKMLEENAEYLMEEEKEIADESKRQGKPKNLDNIFGIEGTFKKLDID